MFDCSNYEYVNQEAFCAVACLSTGQLGKSTWKIVFMIIPLSAIGPPNREVMRIPQARNPKVKCSEKRGAYRNVFNRLRGENNVLRNKDRPLLYFLASIPPRCRQDIDPQCPTGGPIGNSVHFLCLDSIIPPYFFIYKIPPYTTGNKCDCFVTHRY